MMLPHEVGLALALTIITVVLLVRKISLFKKRAPVTTLRTRELSRTVDLSSEVILGTAPLGGIRFSMEEESATALVSKALELGFRLFDTAPHYGLGIAETRLGEGLRRGAASLSRTRGIAAKLLSDEVRVWTKVGRVIVTSARSGEVVESDNLPGSATTIFLDSPVDAVPVLDYSARGAARSYHDSCARLGAGVVIAGLRCHDPEQRERESAALAADGCLRGLSALRAAREAERAAAVLDEPLDRRRSTPSKNKTREETRPPPPLEVSVGLNDAAVAGRILAAVEAGTAPKLDSLMLAGCWNLLDQSGVDVLAACERVGARVDIAGAYASGILAGGTTYRYAAASEQIKRRVRAWRALAEEHGCDLKAACIAFALLPAVVGRVALGVSNERELCETVDLVAAAHRVPRQLWKDAVERRLLPRGLLTL